ncbi:nitrogenase iron-molybdenum cofactor biosynthesis protein NifN [Paenibacillus caui]|uniref:nitrogenase iron-molybdenum cofactor biosynthesis protein NifN n=1 Tax=Paenibacillus caui TaxID=2873927 RepID=UPI001CA8B615|nr:nitrogenase iron-molybdenum cofactor biosynthesis protein NifN [Paenibacillus caui]
MTTRKIVKPLSCNPLKISQPLGGVLAMQGIYRSMPIIHGAQGCTSFAKTLLTRHYREPIAVQTTALQEMDVIFDADRNLEEALETVLSKHRPDVIGVLSTALTEASGTDYLAKVKKFKRDHSLRDTLVVTSSLPDFRGSLESGYSLMVESIIDGLLEQTERRPGKLIKDQINLLPGSHLTAGDVMELKEIIGSFGFEVITLPDLSTSLSGHLLTGFSPLTRGGVPLDSARQMIRSGLTIAIGSSMERPARRLKNAVGIPYRVFPCVSGLASSDEFFYFLQELSRESIPVRYRWQRESLLDCMLDAQFNYAGVSAIVALEPDHLLSAASWMEEMGVEFKGLVASYETPLLQNLDREIWIGDLDDAEQLAEGADLWISNSHGKSGAKRCGAAFMAMGFPVLDELGAYTSLTAGYRGTMELINKAGNRLIQREENAHESSVCHG